MKIKSVTIKSTLITVAVSILLATASGIAVWMHEKQSRDDSFRLAALPSCLEASQGYRQISSGWLPVRDLTTMKEVYSKLRAWHAAHDLYLTSEGRRLYNVLSAAMRYAIDPKISPEERQQRAQGAANLIWPFREALISGSWYASASRDPQSVRVLGE